MNKIIEFLKKFLQTRTIAFYVAIGISFVSVIVGIVSGAALAFAGQTALVIILPIVGFLAFVAFSLVGEDRVGATASGLLTFGAFIALVIGVYSHFMAAIQNQSMESFDLGAIEGLFTLIVCVALLIVCAIAANVLAWLRLKKKSVPDAIEAA